MWKSEIKESETKMAQDMIHDKRDRNTIAQTGKGKRKTTFSNQPGPNR